MSKIDYKALREAAEGAKGKTTWQKIQAFNAVATPEVVLELLDRIERRPAPEEIMQHVFYSLLSKGHTESEAMYAVMKCVESHIPKMVAHTEPLSCTCVRSGGAFMQGDDVLVFRGHLPDSYGLLVFRGHLPDTYGLPDFPFYWTEVKGRNWPLALAFTKEGFVEVATGATFYITGEV